eukprot:2996626-Pyramimonas_sp.AAC.1
MLGPGSVHTPFWLGQGGVHTDCDAGPRMDLNRIGVGAWLAPSDLGRGDVHAVHAEAEPARV